MLVYEELELCSLLIYCNLILIERSISHGGLAQLARAPALHAGGQRFESVILHVKKEDIDILEARKKSKKSKQSVEFQKWSETKAKVYKDFTQRIYE